MKFFSIYRSQISKEAKDLLTKLLAKNPNHRLEAADILDHPWIMKMTKSSSEGVVSVSSLANVRGRVQKYAPLDNDPKSAAIQIQISNPINNEQSQQLCNNIQQPMSPNVLRKAMSTHLWSPTMSQKMSQMSQNRPGVRAVAKMRRQSSVVELSLIHI